MSASARSGQTSTESCELLCDFYSFLSALSALASLRAGRAFVRSLFPFVRSSPLLLERELLRAGAEMSSTFPFWSFELSAGSAFYIWAEEGEAGEGGGFSLVAAWVMFQGTPPRCVGELRLGISWTPRTFAAVGP